MTTITLYNLNVYCRDPSNVIHTHNIWQEQPNVPSCPLAIVDHTLVESEIMKEVSSSTQIIVDDTSGTNGTYRGRGFTYDVAAGPDTEYQIIGEYSAPYNMRLASMTITPAAENIGDSFSFVSARNTVIGGITAPVSSGKSITVSDSVLLYLKVGYEVLLSIDGVNGESLGECFAIDIGAKVVTVEKDVVSAFAPGTFVMMSINRMTDVRLTSDTHVTFGSNNTGSSFAPAGIKGSMLYKNSTATPKKFSFFAETIY